jgi:hypothetical protein
MDVGSVFFWGFCVSKLLQNLTIKLAKLVEFTLAFFLKSQHLCQKMAKFRQDLLPRGQNPLSYYTLIMNVNTISLPW